MIARPKYSFPLLTPKEQHHLLFQLNKTEKDYPSNKCIHQAFEEQVERTPDNVAVLCEGAQLTYKELNEKANQIAHYLRALGVRPDTLVAIAVNRSLEMIIGLLGILKAGGAYVPLDPSYPQDRLQFMLEDSQTPILLTQSHLQEKLKEALSSYPGRIVILDQHINTFTQFSTGNPKSHSLPVHLAYAIYTSGSTGKPKGVLGQHSAIMNRFFWMWDVYPFSTSETAICKTSLSFVDSIWEIFGPLLRGIKILIIPRYKEKDLTYLMDIISEDRIKRCLLVPSLLNVILQSSQTTTIKKQYKKKKLFVVSGEALRSNVKELFERIFPNASLLNLYGSSEVAADVTYHMVNSVDPTCSLGIIGRPISNTQIYILDPYFSPVPIGISGEIYVGGAGLARGYLNHSELTAEKFVPNPFVSEKNIQERRNLRLYRTGDLGRYLTDGNIEFLGRIDNQVKIRGFRIELGEVEFALSQHSDVLQAVVLAREDESDHKRLVAYVVPQEQWLSSLHKETELISSAAEPFSVLRGDGLPSFTEELRSQLSLSLPEHMIPSFFVFLDQLPLTPNGKVDRKALPAPNVAIRIIEESYVAPHNTLEQNLCIIWSEVLKIEKIGIHDSFFKLGGHSLLATQVVSRIRSNYNFDIPLKTFFENPTISALARVVESLNKEKCYSLTPPITLKERPDHIPLSFAQQRLWFLDQLLPEKVLYNIPLALRLKGPLNIINLEKTFNTIIDRHESLRTVFPVYDGQASQLILPHLIINLSENLVDLSSFTTEDQLFWVNKYIQEETNKSFDLSSGPLIKAKILILRRDDHALLITLHHIISDGWSIDIFFKELSTLYNAYSSGEDQPLSPLPIQYTHFTLWQREWLQGSVLEDQLSYWKQQLSSIPDLLEFPTDRTRPKELTHQGAAYYYTLPQAIKDQLNNLTQHHQVSLFMTLLAILQILLYRYTGQKDIVVGSPIANRHYQEIEGLIGFFVNTLALRTTFKEDESFIDVLSKVKETTLQAYQYQDVPFEQLVDYLNVSRTLNHNPVFQVMFVLQSAMEGGSPALRNLQIEHLPSVHSTAKFDFSVLAYEHEKGIRLEFEYATDLFEEETIKRFAQHFEELIKGIVTNPNQFIHCLPLLTQKEQHRLLIEWNNTAKPYLEDLCIHQLFEEQVERIPDNIAVAYEETQLTYKELNEKANQLAHHIRQTHEINPDTLIALCLDRSEHMLIGILATLKAGGAYVPIDPSYPDERIQYILEDTNTQIVLTNEVYKQRLESINKVKSTDIEAHQQPDILAIDHPVLQEALRSQLTSNLSTSTASTHLAYVIYTSGTTGKPKGVMIEHKGAVNALQSQSNYLNINNHTEEIFTFGLLSNYVFDASISGMFLPLTLGYKLVIAAGLSKINISEFIGKNQINMTIISSQILTLLDDNVISLKAVIVGGEKPDKLIIEKLIKLDIKIFQEYGLAESSIVSTYKQLDLTTKVTTIGSPISNTKCYILDHTLTPLPIGAIGELYIGGVGLARGYLNRSDLTAERFVPNPFIAESAREVGLYSLSGMLEEETSGLTEALSANIPETDFIKSSNLRLYRTGDLARYSNDGNIEFIGRADDQVKIRGFRIELGEIESILNTYRDVAQAVVVVREDEPGNKKLVVYVVPHEEKIFSLTVESTLTSSSGETFSVLNGESLPTLTEDLTNHLVRSLPDYMVPSFFVYMNDVPLTPNGKIDRKALPTPDLSLRQVDDEYAAPRTSLEQDLCAIWGDVLKIKKVGIHDNFFKLGGHSLLATQVISRVRHVFNVDISLKALFEHSTIFSLSIVVDSLRNENVLSSLPPIVPMERKDYVPLSFAQQRLWFLDQLLPDVALYNIPLALKLKGSLNIQALEKAFNTLIQRHESLRTVFSSNEGEAYQVILPNISINLTVCSQNLTHLKKKERTSVVEKLTQQEANAPFNLSTGPLIRVKLLIFSKEEHILLITMHHIISDGWSMGIFFKEFSELYNSYDAGKEISLPLLSIQYADFALWQRRWLQGEVIEQQLSYWKRHLAGIPELLELPTDKPRPKELTYKGATCGVSLSREIKNQLNQLAQQHQVSLFMALLAVFQVLLYRYTGQKDIVVGSPIANRHYKETEELIGFFVNTLALRTTFEGNESFTEVLNRVKETTLQAYHHQDVPFEQLVDHLNIARVLNRNPVFQVMFALQNEEGKNFSLQGIQHNPITLSSSLVRFDLSIRGYEYDQGVGIVFDYATDLFEADTIERLIQCFKELVQAIVRDPSQSIHTYPLLTSQEEYQLLIKWNNTNADYPGDECIHELFEEQVTKTPNNIAVVYEDQELSYQQLNERSNQLAHYLRKIGVGPDTLVAIVVERSLEMVVGLLGILKAGGAYVPIDPTYPQERLEFMLVDAKAHVLLTQSSLKTMFSHYPGTILTLDHDWDIIQQETRTNPPSLISPHHLAYVIYTSGSTGKPKGVMIEHTSLVNYTKSILNNLRLKTGLKAALLSTFSTDLGNTSFYPSLLRGLELHILAEEIILERDFLFSYLSTKKIDLLKITPSYLQALINEINLSSKLPVKYLILGGELLTNTLCNDLEKSFKKLRLLNHYGPTETTIGCCVFEVNKKSDNLQESVPIGQPISNTQIYILDRYLNPVPIGVTGEIFIGGRGLSRGYLNRADLTSERFIPNPFIRKEKDPALRLYRTGDLARHLSDGNIEFIGRVDDQVKIRGFRIELGEIESVLNTHGDVAQTVVVIKNGEIPVNKKLVAYIVPGEFTPSINELKEFLLEKLPEYMIPTLFVYLEKLPLTINGKLDRKALPDPEFVSEESYVAPRDELEKQVCQIWAEVLNLPEDKVGIRDDFFRLGGDSILTIRLINKLKKALDNKSIHISNIFKHNTIEKYVFYLKNNHEDSKKGVEYEF